MIGNDFNMNLKNLKVKYYNSNFNMESNHPFAQVNTKRDPKEIMYDLVEIKWG